MNSWSDARHYGPADMAIQHLSRFFDRDIGNSER